MAATATETTVTDPVKAVTETVAAEATKTVAGSAFALWDEFEAVSVVIISSTNIAEIAESSLAMAQTDVENDKYVLASRSLALIPEPSILTLMVLGLFGLLGLNRRKVQT